MATVTTDPPASLQSLASPPPRLLYRMSMEKYEAMVQSGVFTKRDRLQLVEGFLVGKMTDHPPHASVSVTTADAVRAILPQGWHLRCEKPLRITSRASLPEPDIVVARGRSQDYLKRHPEPVDVSLVR
jgi:Uma2 family endonuclease